jgi:hypothetical protein
MNAVKVEFTEFDHSSPSKRSGDISGALCQMWRGLELRGKEEGFGFVTVRMGD